MRYILLLFFIPFNSATFCQNTDSIKSRPINELIPTIGNGPSGFSEYFKENLIYPEYAYTNKISGIVYVCFTVDANKWVKNHVTNVHVVRSIHPSLDFAAISMVLGIPGKWDPAPRGIYDTVRFVYPIKFDFETVKTEQVSDCFDKKIKELLAMDSTTLHTLLYKDKPVDRELYVPPPLVKDYRKNEQKSSSKHIEINGTILDLHDKGPIPGVQILEIGTMNATLSNYDGEFSLSIDKNSEVEISSPGYEPQFLKFRKSKLSLKIYLYNGSTIYEIK